MKFIHWTKELMSVLLCGVLVWSTQPVHGLEPPVAGAANQEVPAPLSAVELQGLVAPIALYPDALVAQVLGGATYPDQIAYASNWLHQNQSLTGKLLVQAVDAQQWDPSVKALTEFPSVLENMGKNLSWTSSLGEAYNAQPADTMMAIQVLRAKAKAAGNLTSGSQMVVVQQDPSTIVIQSANPQVVYVPMYNPGLVYGYPYVTPQYSTAAMVTSNVLAFGAGIAVGAVVNGGYRWGYNSWNCGWQGGSVVYQQNNFYGNSAWRGGANGSGAVQYGSRNGAYGATAQGSNANGSWGKSVASKNGNTAYSQHQTTAKGTTGSVQTTNGGRAVGASGANNSAAAGETASGNKYASANGNTYKNTGSGWQSTKNDNPSGQRSAAPSTSGAASRGWGSGDRGGGASAFGGGGGGGWQERSASARGGASRGRR